MSLRTHACPNSPHKSVLILAALLIGCPSEPEERAPALECPEEFEVDPDVVYGEDGEWPRVVVNEFMARNRVTVADGTGRWADWLELAGITDDAVDLAGWTLTDDPEEIDKHVLDPMELAGGGYLLLWADNSPDLGPTHLDFNLAAAGGFLGLYAPDGTAMDLVTYGPQAADVALARTPNHTGAWDLVATATPGSSNGGGR